MTASDAKDDREQLIAGIEQTRHDLAETVEALAAKADVASRVRGKTAQVRGQIGGKFSTLTRTARDRAPGVRDQVSKAGRVIPEPARRTVTERPAVLYAAAGACVAAGLWMWRMGGRRP
ncbi:DUF3618 domain-containing protein [Actinoallomurus bryophytorum]|uniref:DUF3618 domain-containing protein n=1 Tax=Actinoallomurus bryophytorum TaxID=1490222 RepID=UPI00163B2370|nr:DUF3618 domain-containing protein [Actinoallomurus bryophytorum]